MSDLLKKIFGSSLSEMDYSFPSGTPAYIIYGYSIKKYQYCDKCFLVAGPVSESWNLGTIKKHVQKIAQLNMMPCVIELSHITALQRTNLIENHISFISGSGQIFLPFLGCYFESRIADQLPVPEVMNAAAQHVFLYLFYYSQDNEESVNLTQIAKALNISKATCTRALKQLLSLKLVHAEDVGAAKWIRLAGDRGDIVNRAFSVMSSPVSKILYVKDVPEGIDYLISNLKALSQITMIAARESDAGFAITADTSRKISKEIQMSYQDYLDFGGYAIEVWRYDPFRLSANERVDDLSLVLELQDSEDERIQNCLDELRSKYGIEVDNTW